MEEPKMCNKNRGYMLLEINRSAYDKKLIDLNAKNNIEKEIMKKYKLY